MPVDGGLEALDRLSADPPVPVPPERLRRRTDAGSLGFATTADLPEMDGILGQDRALEAVRFGLAIARPGFNLFLLGPLGVGKRTLASKVLGEMAAKRPVPADWVYVNNFADPRRPKALRLPAGRGTRFRDDMARLVEELRTAIPAAFESDDYRTRNQMLQAELKEQQEQSFGAVEEEARARGIGLIRTPVGLAFAPIRDGKVVPPAAFETWPEEERKRVEKSIEELQQRLQAAVEDVQRRQKAIRDRLRRRPPDRRREARLLGPHRGALVPRRGRAPGGERYGKLPAAGAGPEHARLPQAQRRGPAEALPRQRHRPPCRRRRRTRRVRGASDA
jgi:hypothetical protein